MRWISIKAAFLVILALCNIAGAVAQDHESFERQFKQDIAALGTESIEAVKVIYVSGDVGPWLDTGLKLRPGDQITTIALGQRWLSFEHNLSFESDLALWKRIGEGTEIFRGGKAHTFSAENEGSLELKLYPTVRWLGIKGEYDGEPPLLALDTGGGISVAILHWKRGVNISTALEKLSINSVSDHWAALALAELRAPEETPPPGWQFLHELGPSSIWSVDANPSGANAPSRAIKASINNDVSIITKTADLPLDHSSTLRWKWRMDNIPGETAENSPLAHDYLSIAVAFDNGQDLTYYWSKEIEVGSHFACPLPGWVFRETHIVARSGEKELGKWLTEEKNILADYQQAIGGELPKRITGVWLIGVGIFKKVAGAGAFGGIVLTNDAQHLRVF